MTSAATAEPSPKQVKLVIGASSAGTIFEWYDFFIYGTLAASGIIGRTFFPAGSDVLQSLLAWAGFAIGFGFRPLGAILFGYLGDRLGRKYTFLVTIVLMGAATAGVGLVPSAETIGIAAPILIILLRIAQGLALGGEYGGAAVYVAEHAAPHRRGYFTSFIQASVVGGFVLSLAVVLLVQGVMDDATWNAWGWRVPFLLSILLLVISLWMRLKLSESPVFAAMKAQGSIARNPFTESFTYPGNKRRIMVALFGIAAGLTVIWYTAMFSALSFLQGPMRVEPTTAQLIVGGAGLLSMGFFILFGWISDRVGRKRPIVIGYILTLILVFPLFKLIGSVANPALAEAAARAPVTVAAAECNYDPFAGQQASACGRILAELTRLGIQYRIEPMAGGPVTLRIGAAAATDPAPAAVQSLLEGQGYDFAPVVPSPAAIAIIVAAILALSALSGATFGPVAALLAEMFPARIRYSSLSIPYHFGTGYFGGFLPFIASYVVARTGDPYAGLWYMWWVVLMALLVSLWGLAPGKPTDFDEQPD